MSEPSNCTFGPRPTAELDTNAKFNAFKQRSVESHSPLICSGSVFVDRELSMTTLLAPLRWLALALMFALGSGACSSKEKTVGLEIVDYNHTIDRSIYNLSVNGAGAPGSGPRSGGGSFTCCVQIPKIWHPGMKVKIAWEYQAGDILPPPPPNQAVEVEVPQYGPNDLGFFAVHFYPGHKVKVLVTRLTIKHPDYPADLRWEASTTAK